MIEKDNIQELFSKSLENHTLPVRPELWAGVQAKMAVAATASTATAAASKGVSLLTKWIVGGLITSSAVVAGVVITSEDKPVTNKATQEQTSQVTTAEAKADEVKSETSFEDNSKTNSTAATKSRNNQERIITQNDNTNEVVNSNAVVSSNSESEIKKENPTVVSNPTKNVVSNPDQKQQKQEAPVDKKVTEDEPKKPVAPVTPAAVKVHIVFPNIFTPNNDGENDQYLLKQHDNVSSDDFSVTIMDASNVPVWKDDNPNFNWDGTTMSGEKAPEGKYICMIVGKDSSGKQFSKYTVFELKRD